MHLAAEEGHFEVVKHLLKCGAIYDIEDNAYNKPLNLAEDKNIIQLLKLIDRFFEYVIDNQEILLIIEIGELNTDKFEAVTNARNRQGHTLLEVAITNRHENIARELSEIISVPIPELEEAKIETFAGSSRRRGLILW